MFENPRALPRREKLLAFKKFGALSRPARKCRLEIWGVQAARDRRRIPP
jgi:hypothetical protein